MNVECLEFDPSENVRFHYSSYRGHYWGYGTALVEDASTGCAGASEARVLDNSNRPAKLAAER